MVKIRINKDKLIPNFAEYLKILASVFLLVYIFKLGLLKIFPILSNLPDFWALVFWVLLITYLKDLFDVQFAGRDWF